MPQRTPDVDEHDVERILRRDYSGADLDSIRDLIAQLEVQAKSRVVMACLKIAAGSMEALKRQLGEASGYYREIIAEAESPRATKVWSRIEKLTEEQRQEIYDQDWQQYEAWLRRG